MDTPHHDRRRRRQRQLTLFLAVKILAFSFFILASDFSLNPSRQLSDGGREMEVRGVARRLGGPGSSPPACRSKCGRCTPCKPVHVPIHPGFSMKLEYYPEAWRCKCKDKLFMP